MTESEKNNRSDEQPASQPLSPDAAKSGDLGNSAESQSRRKFLKVVGTGVAATLGAGIACPLIAPIATSITDDHVRYEGTEVDCGPTAEFHSEPRRVDVVAAKRDAWTKTTAQVIGSVFVRRVDAKTFEAFSSICPHTSCSVTYVDTDKRYVCPCHKTYFGVDGAKLEGPSKRGLDSLPVKVVNDRVIVTYMKFKPGIAVKEQV